MSKVNPSRWNPPSFPPWVSLASRTVTSWPLTRSRAAAAIPPRPAPITMMRAMSAHPRRATLGGLASTAGRAGPALVSRGGLPG